MAEPRPDDGPYVGPRPFERSEHARFFGREQEAHELASLVVAHRVVVLYAASGAGKTSLLNAGAIPLLEEDDAFEVLPPVRLRGLATADEPGNPYLANLLGSLTRALGDERPASEGLAGYLAARPHAEGPDDLPAPRALVIDQFEELFTLYPQRWHERSEVFDALAVALEQDPLLRVVLSIREDFIAQLDPYAGRLPTRLRTRIRLEPLRRPAALAAVARPLAGDARAFAPGVSERLVDELLKVRIHTLQEESVEVPGEFAEPVQLQVVCRTLWSSLPPGVQEIGEADLARIGSVSDVLASYYDEAVRAAASLGGMAEPDLRERLEAAFITPVGTRGTVVGGGDRIAGMPEAAIAEFESRHLVRAEWRAGARWFELTHDSLIRPIVSSNAAVRRTRQRRRDRWLKGAVGGLIAVAGLLIVLLVAGRHEGQPAKPPAIGVLQAHAPLAGLRLVRTFAASGTPVAMTTTAGGRGLLVGGLDGRIRVWDLNAGREIGTLDYGETGLSSVDAGPDGTEILAAGRLGLRRWRMAALGRVPPDEVHPHREADEQTLSDARQPITAAVYGASGGTTAEPARPAAQARSDGPPVRPASPAAAAVAVPVVTSQDRALGIVRDGVGQLESPDSSTSRPLFTRKVLRLRYSPAGTAIAGIGVDGTVRLRDLRPARGIEQSPRPVGPERILRTPGASVVSVAFGADGGLIATASDDGTARLWNARTARLVRTLRSGTAPLSDAQLSPDGRLIATAGGDGVLRVWTIAGKPVAVLRASRRPLSALTWAAGGQLIVTTGADAAVRVWANAASERPLAARTCSQALFLSPPSPEDAAASADDGRAYVAWISCPAHAGEVVRAPESGTLTSACAPRRLQHVALLADSGRCWVFAGAAARGGTGRVAAGAEIGRVVRRDVRIELWQSEHGGRRLANVWNPTLFLRVASSGAGHHVAALPYPGDNASPKQIARWMGGTADAAGLPPELPVMTSLVTSGLRNLNFGDRDSVGFFQMRLGIWNVGAYAGFADKPGLQMKWFIDQAERVRRQRPVDPAGHPNCYGEWAADIIRPPAKYRGRFQLRLREARSLLGLPGTPVRRSGSCRRAAAPITGAMGGGG